MNDSLAGATRRLPYRNPSQGPGPTVKFEELQTKVIMRGGHLSLYIDHGRGWRWRFRARNGRILSSPQAFASKVGAQRNILAIARLLA